MSGRDAPRSGSLCGREDAIACIVWFDEGDVTGGVSNKGTTCLDVALKRGRVEQFFKELLIDIYSCAACSEFYLLPIL